MAAWPPHGPQTAVIGPQDNPGQGSMILSSGEDERPTGAPDGPWVVRLNGGMADPAGLAGWLDALVVAARHRPIVLAPGGGDFLAAVREAHDMWRLAGGLAHRMALFAM